MLLVPTLNGPTAPTSAAGVDSRMNDFEEELRLLEELEKLQDEVLTGLDDLNQRLEDTLAELGHRNRPQAESES